MPYASDAASRSGRDRDLLPDTPRMGPYEAPYDVRRGYQQPLRRTARRREPEPEILLLGREEEVEKGEG